MANDVRVKLTVERIDEGVGRELVMELLHDLAERYGAPDPDEPSPQDLAPPRGVFLVAWHDGNAVGCGGVRAHDDRVGELKRMYVRPAARRSGVARAVLTALEQRADELGYQRLILETGTEQPEAIALYVASGYQPIDPYGEHKDSPMSRCFAKDL